MAIYGVVTLGFSGSGLGLALLLYFVLLALGGSSAAQKGVLWWASHHRIHHKKSDQPGDVHSPRDGWFYSHVGWIIVPDWEETDWDGIKDMARYPELRFLNRFHLLPPIALAVALFFIGGEHALYWGFFVSTVLLWHGTFTINSLSHIFGRRRYETTDDSKNNWLLALITMGEGWHNNHHHYMSSANQGFRWYELDMSYLILRFLGLFGLVWDIRKAPAHIVENVPRPASAAAPAAAPPGAAPPGSQYTHARPGFDW
jgi:stearoyl-CoA desaturase (delta-9 desaturase)